MRRSVLFIFAIWLCFGLTSYVTAQQPRAKSAQMQALPKFRTGTPYPKVREMLMALGWQPETLPTATPCGDDDRCRGFPEVYFCSGVGQAVCVYMWKKKTTLIRVFGSGESAGQAYDGLKPCPLHPTQFDPECGGRAPSSARTESKPKISGSTDCAFCGTWEYVGSWNQDMSFKSYVKISQAGTGKLKIIEGSDNYGWNTLQRNIYLKMLNGRLVGTFVTSNFLYSTDGVKTTYKITCELTSNNKMRYSVWSAIQGRTQNFVGTKISN